MRLQSAVSKQCWDPGQPHWLARFTLDVSEMTLACNANFQWFGIRTCLYKIQIYISCPVLFYFLYSAGNIQQGLAVMSGCVCVFFRIPLPLDSHKAASFKCLRLYCCEQFLILFDSCYGFINCSMHQILLCLYKPQKKIELPKLNTHTVTAKIIPLLLLLLHR